MFLVHIQEVFLAESILILIGGFKHELYFHPSHWRNPSFFKMVIVPPTRPLLTIPMEIHMEIPMENTEYPQTLELVRWTEPDWA